MNLDIAPGAEYISFDWHSQLYARGEQRRLPPVVAKQVRRAVISAGSPQRGSAADCPRCTQDHRGERDRIDSGILQRAAAKFGREQTTPWVEIGHKGKVRPPQLDITDLPVGD